jgi:hypothetical protein
VATVAQNTSFEETEVVQPESEPDKLTVAELRVAGADALIWGSPKPLSRYPR